MYLSKHDASDIGNLISEINAILDQYEEEPYDQIDCLRAKTCEISDIVDSWACAAWYDPESVRDEQMQTNIYDFCEPIEN